MAHEKSVCLVRKRFNVCVFGHGDGEKAVRGYYERKNFRRYFLGLTGIFFLLIWIVAWICCDFHAGKGFLIGLVLIAFAISVAVLMQKFLGQLYQDVDRISTLMMDVVEGREDYTAEVYKQGSLGILYTNFYKMVTVLRESQMREGEEKVFLRDTISDISHQLKTPLASLRVFVDLLYDEKIKEEAKKKEVLEEAKRQLDRMEWMVLAMLKLARIEAGSVIFDRKMHDAGSIIAAAIEGVNYLLEKRGQKVVTVLPQGKGAPLDTKLLCDGEWLTEGLINLLKNASDYSKEQTTITITLEENALFTRIHIQDEGVGIEAQKLPHIFKRFYRVDPAVNAGSVGIGLALTKSIVEGMKGKITVRSEVGKYTCFTLTFLK